MIAKHSLSSYRTVNAEFNSSVRHCSSLSSLINPSQHLIHIQAMQAARITAYHIIL